MRRLTRRLIRLIAAQSASVGAKIYGSEGGDAVSDEIETSTEDPWTAGGVMGSGAVADIETAAATVGAMIGLIIATVGAMIGLIICTATGPNIVS